MTIDEQAANLEASYAIVYPPTFYTDLNSLICKNLLSFLARRIECRPNVRDPGRLPGSAIPLRAVACLCLPVETAVAARRLAYPGQHTCLPFTLDSLTPGRWQWTPLRRRAGDEYGGTAPPRAGN
jgi:hypothetical protein